MDTAPVVPLVKGLLTFVPGIEAWLPRRRPGGSHTAAYCHEAWLKHLTLAYAHGLAQMPATVAELGPGDSLGFGLAALLSGVERYVALDVVPYARNGSNVALFDELVELFQARTGLSTRGWPNYAHLLDETLFPRHILTDDVLAASLARDRLQVIRRALADLARATPKDPVSYIAPWSDARAIERDSVDLIVSHSVLEHVTDLPETYRAMCAWLKPGGWMSHQIDLGAHGLTTPWNGFRALPEPIWTLMAGRRSFLINRQPASAHFAQLTAGGCDVVCAFKRMRPDDSIPRSRLAPAWQALSDDDLACASVFVQAVKRGPRPLPAGAQVTVRQDEP